jgi:hypothetical protein
MLADGFDVEVVEGENELVEFVDDVVSSLTQTWSMNGTLAHTTFTASMRSS